MVLTATVITALPAGRFIRTVQQFRPRGITGLRPFTNATGAPNNNGDGTHSEGIEWTLADGNTYFYRSFIGPLSVIEVYDNQLNLIVPYDVRAAAGGLFYNAVMRGQCYSKE